MHIDIAGDCPGIELNTQSLELLEKFCYLSNIRGAGNGVVASILPRIGRRWGKFRYLLPLLASRGFPLGTKCKQESLCVVTIAMICSNLASIWKFQNSRRPIYKPVEHLWWSFYCKNSKPLSIFTKKHACLSSKYASSF